MSVRIENNFRQGEKLVLERVQLLLGKLASDIEAWAKIYAPVDTGFLMGSIRAVPESALSWLVKVGAEYGAYVELGTRFMGEQPYMLPAVVQVKSLARKMKVPATFSGPAAPE